MERKLKYATWKLNREKKTIKLTTYKIVPNVTKYGNVGDKKVRTGTIRLNKTYLFSLMRFLVSAGQKLTVIPRKKKNEE